jgi:hypothetical protein
MTRRLGVLVVFLVLASTGARAGEPIRIRGGACVILIDPTDGSLVVARMAGQAAPSDTAQRCAQVGHGSCCRSSLVMTLNPTGDPFSGSPL